MANARAARSLASAIARRRERRPPRESPRPPAAKRSSMQGETALDRDARAHASVQCVNAPAPAVAPFRARRASSGPSAHSARRSEVPEVVDSERRRAGGEHRERPPSQNQPCDERRQRHAQGDHAARTCGSMRPQFITAGTQGSARCREAVAGAADGLDHRRPARTARAPGAARRMCTSMVRSSM